MPVTFQTKAESVASTANASVSEPSGTTSGDLLLGLFCIENTATSITAPTGWTPLYTAGSAGTGSNSFKFWLGYVVRGGSAPTYTFTNPALYREWHVFRFAGNDTGSPIDSSAQLTSALGNPYNPNPPSTTPVDTAALAVAGGVGWAGSGGGGWAHAAYTIRARNTAGDDAILATRQLASGAAEDPAAFTGAGAGNVPGWAFTLTIKNAGAAAAVRNFGTLGVGT